MLDAVAQALKALFLGNLFENVKNHANSAVADCVEAHRIVEAVCFGYHRLELFFLDGGLAAGGRVVGVGLCQEASMGFADPIDNLLDAAKAKMLAFQLTFTALCHGESRLHLGKDREAHRQLAGILELLEDAHVVFFWYAAIGPYNANGGDAK